MDDWQLAIGIVGIAIIIAIILSKRSWAHNKKKRKPVEQMDETESTNPIGTVFAVVIGLVATFFTVKFIMWIFSKVPVWIAALAPPPSMNTTGTSVFSGTFNIVNSSGWLPFIVVAMIIICTLMVFGSRAFKRNGVLIFIFMVPILYFLGVSLTWILVAGAFIIPIIVWRGMRRLY